MPKGVSMYRTSKKIRYVEAFCLSVVEFLLCSAILQVGILLVIPYDTHTVAAGVIVCGLAFPCSGWIAWKSYSSKIAKIDKEFASSKEVSPVDDVGDKK
ncbi:MAG: hypothetical protein JWN70_447 [Planctomycetaceae bacterium]|nr:hypothetical protein [Planctomycetaceae bacterium]